MRPVAYLDSLGVLPAEYQDARSRIAAEERRASVVREYDDAHHMTYEAYSGTDGSPILVSGGYSARRFQYDPETGETTRIDYYGMDGSRILLPQGYAAYEIQYDHAGNVILRAYYDEAGALTVPASPGYARMERTTDAQGRITAETYYGADGSLLVNRDGYAAIETVYEGGKTTVTYLDAERQPANTAFGYAIIETETDYRGNNLYTAYFGADGKPVKIADGYAREERTWDYEGYLLSLKYTDENGNPSECPKGYASYICEYDLKGNLVREVYYAADGSVVPSQHWVLARWNDGSVKWMGFYATLGPDQAGQLRLDAVKADKKALRAAAKKKAAPEPTLVQKDDAAQIVIDNGLYEIAFAKSGSRIIDRITGLFPEQPVQKIPPFKPDQHRADIKNHGLHHLTYPFPDIRKGQAEQVSACPLDSNTQPCSSLCMSALSLSSSAIASSIVLQAVV